MTLAQFTLPAGSGWPGFVLGDGLPEPSVCDGEGLPDGAGLLDAPGLLDADGEPEAEPSGVASVPVPDGVPLPEVGPSVGAVEADPVPDGAGTSLGWLLALGDTAPGCGVSARLPASEGAQPASITPVRVSAAQERRARRWL